MECYAGLAKLLVPWRTPVSADVDDAVLKTTPAADVPSASDGPIPTASVRHVSPQVVAALLSQPRCLLSTRQAQTVDVLKAQCPGFTAMRRLRLRSFEHDGDRICNTSPKRGRHS
jgi:hypothetical protein